VPARRVVIPMRRPPLGPEGYSCRVAATRSRFAMSDGREIDRQHRAVRPDSSVAALFAASRRPAACAVRNISRSSAASSSPGSSW
jgi:hypothetical protein